MNGQSSRERSDVAMFYKDKGKPHVGMVKQRPKRSLINVLFSILYIYIT